MKLRRVKLKTVLMLLVPLAVSLCFFQFSYYDGYGTLTFQPGISWWWNTTSPLGEQTGVAIQNGGKVIISLEGWNGGIFVNFNYYPGNPDHLKSGYWLKAYRRWNPKEFENLIPAPPESDEFPPAPEAPAPPISQGELKGLLMTPSNPDGELPYRYVWRTFDFHTGHQREFYDGKELLGDLPK